jgi:fermentation-respiration switch protein FrsA (DUF1100 family)
MRVAAKGFVMSAPAKIRTFAVSALITMVIIYAIALAGVFVFQRHLLYFPTRVYVSPRAAHVGTPFQEIMVTTEDGLDLKGWYVPAASQPFTIMFFHGNADSLRTAAAVAAPYVAAGYGFFLAEYRGYSGLPGSPTETGLYTDARAYLRYLINSGVRADHIVLFGHSLGTGVAVQMAGEFKVGGLILLSPYMSLPKAAQVHYPVFPAEYLTLDRFENFKKIPNLHMPLLIAHGGRDNVIPPAQGKQLFALANEPKQFFFLADRGHNDMFNGFDAASLDWLKQLAATTAAMKD